MMDYENLTLFSLEEFTDSSHGMTARSTKSKRKVDHPMNRWENTNQPPLNTEKQSPSSKNAIALQASRTRLKRGLRLLWRVKIEPLTSSITN